MHLGTHLGGFIITRDPIASWTPLQWAAKGTVVSQYDKDDIEALGLVKMDILGLRMHSAISEAVELARERVGEDAVPEPFDLPKDDPRVYEMIASADTVGMFQLESSGQRNLSTRLKSSTFEDIIAQISLFRPGPLEAEMITPFIRRRHGLEPVERAARGHARGARRLLRRHRLPGAGAARRARGRRLRPRRGRLACAAR